MLKTLPNETPDNYSTGCLDDQDPGYLLQQRLELVEDLWKTVLKSECPPDQTERLLRLKELSDPSKTNQDNSSHSIVQLITEMDLAEAISAARAFSLYFQLVNILEQRIEEDSYLESMK